MPPGALPLPRGHFVCPGTGVRLAGSVTGSPLAGAPAPTPPHGRTGNAVPTIWWEGRVVGGWAQRGGGEIVYRLPEDVGAEAAEAVAAAADRLRARLGDVGVTPRFRTPLERELGR